MLKGIPKTLVFGAPKCQMPAVLPNSICVFTVQTSSLERLRICKLLGLVWKGRTPFYVYKPLPLKIKNMATQRSNFSRSSETSNDRPRREDTFQNSDDEYLAMIEQYKGSPYYDAMLNNPWLYGNNKKFSPNLGQQILGWFGDNSAEDAYYADLLNKRNQEFQKQLALHNEYIQNLPNQQVAMQQAAGINSDLTGLSQTPIPENDQAEVPFNMPSESQFGDITRFGFTLVSSLFNFGQSIQAMEMNSLQLASQEIKNHKDAMDFVIESIAKSAPFKDVNELDEASLSQLSDYVIQAASKADYSHYSRRTRKTMKRLFEQYDTMLKSGKDSLGVAAFKAQLRNSFVQNQSAAASGASQNVFDESFNKMVKNVAEAFSDLQFKLERLNLEAGITSAEEAKSENRYNKAYFDYAHSEGLYRSEIDNQKEGYEAQKKAFEAEKMINDTWDKVISYLKGGDEWYNSLGVILATYLRSQTLHLPSINISGPKSTTNVTNRDEHYDKKVIVNSN